MRYQTNSPVSSRRPDMSELPLIRLNSAAVLVAALDKMHLPTDAILDGVGLKRSAFENAETFVPALVIYQFCEDAAAAAGDPAFLAHLGEAVNTATWPPMVTASAEASDLGQLLTRFAIEATEHSSAQTQSLEIHGDRAVFYGRRAFEPSFVPAQIDGFFAAMMVSVIRRAMGDDWNAHNIVVTVSDPSALPPLFFGIKAIRGDRHGYRLGFPSSWLTTPFHRSEFEQRSTMDATSGFPARKAAAAIEQALRPFVGEVALTSQSASKLCGKSERSISRLLEKENTSLGEILVHLKTNYAVEMLKQTDRPIEDIAHALGYSAPTSFTRSFKEWVGQTPSEFRRQANTRLSR